MADPCSTLNIPSPHDPAIDALLKSHPDTNELLATHLLWALEFLQWPIAKMRLFCSSSLIAQRRLIDDWENPSKKYAKERSVRGVA